jgi:hypothetical protein
MRWIGLLVGAVFLVSMCGCSVHMGASGGKGVPGSGVVKTESRSVANFAAVDLKCVGKVVITQSGKEALSVTAEDNLLPLLQTQVVDGTLQIDLASGVDLKPTKSIEFDIDVKKLTNLTVSGAGSIQANQIAGKELTVALPGAGSVVLSGKVTDLHMTLEGAGNLDAAQLKTDEATVDNSGVGRVVVNADKRLKVSLSGVGSVEYIGSPQLEKEVSGLGKVTQRQ